MGTLAIAHVRHNGNVETLLFGAAMWRRALAASLGAVVLAAVHGAPVPIVPGATLELQQCASGTVMQQLSVQASGAVTDASGTLCVTYVGASPAALAMQPCSAGSAAQKWTFSPSSGVFEGNVGADGACLAWNAQGGDGIVSTLPHPPPPPLL
jgi:hypothetical protein